ncbi:phosphatidate cytidylyltransferase, mitochondrial isoform X1 [Olea europaea subsp. europaea]|uniref:Phosphatidate cytidylyltransferase, mitochondrial n=1 Tax=Olea europaea subsp. europaea TaxID=158383 RepID=A0A8S0QGC8_OLEEU|nr:phosphatidate cytidylyltransferase, mitochondrial isoform X1 [Olea europaea subsp. europaea]
MYKPFLEEYAAKHLLRLSLSGDNKVNITQDCGLSTSRSLISYLPQPLRSQMGTELGEKKRFDESGRTVREVVIKSKEEAAECMQKILRRKVMVSSARQAVAGLLTVGVVHGFQYLAISQYLPHLLRSIEQKKKGKRQGIPLFASTQEIFTNDKELLKWLEDTHRIINSDCSQLFWKEYISADQHLSRWSVNFT